MTWKQATISRILLIIARMLAEDPDLCADLRHLSNHINFKADQ